MRERVRSGHRGNPSVSSSGLYPGIGIKAKQASFRCNTQVNIASTR